jgi:hypothetical protein
VLRADPAVTGGHGHEFLAKELIVLADLVASHSEEFPGRAAGRGCTHGALRPGDYSPASTPTIGDRASVIRAEHLSQALQPPAWPAWLTDTDSAE